MNWSQRASTRQHNKSLVGGTICAFRLRSDKRPVELDFQRTQCHADTVPLSCSYPLRATVSSHPRGNIPQVLVPLPPGTESDSPVQSDDGIQ